MKLDDGETGNKMGRPDIAIPLILGIFCFVFLLDLMPGSVNIPLDTLVKIITGGTGEKTWMNIFWDWRVPKAITSLFVGGALALSGPLMQTYFRKFGAPVIIRVTVRGAKFRRGATT